MEGLKKVAVICILKHQDKFLLLERLKEPNKDLFTPLGGKIDPFETPLDAAKTSGMHWAGSNVGTAASATQHRSSARQAATTGHLWAVCPYAYGAVAQ